ncbi:class I SAM-dependent methyltransferase [Metabacillus mangrovi]|nr:class I SAM-dependent methyltransferase [Metabacillus mangrovi]
MSDYLDMLSVLGIAGAHPGGLQLTKQLMDEWDLPFPARILDAGCGTGQTLHYLSQLGHQPEGVDADPRMVNKARNRLQSAVPVSVGLIENLPAKNNQFDAVLCESVLSFSRTESALKEIWRVLKDGGRLAAAEMTLENALPEEDEKEIAGFYKFTGLLTEKEWIAAIEAAGFHDVRFMQHDRGLLDQNQPDHELDMDENIPPEIFEVLDTHRHILQKYKKALGFRLYLAEK